MVTSELGAGSQVCSTKVPFTTEGCETKVPVHLVARLGDSGGWAFSPVQLMARLVVSEYSTDLTDHTNSERLCGSRD
jgi:hypothetical protein